MDGQTFWLDVLANFLPDLAIALVFGYWLSQRLQKRQTDTEIRRQKRSGAAEVRKRRNEILTLLKFELQENIRIAQYVVDDLEQGKGISLPGLRAEVWDTFTSSGQLSWLSNDLKLFNRFTSGYHSIKAIVAFEAHYFETILQYQGTQRENLISVAGNHLIKGYRQYITTAKDFLENDPKVKDIKTDMFANKEVTK